ncbi:MAG: hypothetical protein U9O20_01665 [Patescibacteria group bacterium]|nr:hypothetical protein [Patescibacteria group bacterium]
MNLESYIKSKIACEIVRSMLKEAGLVAISLRDEYILDRSMSRRIQKPTPLKVFLRRQTRMIFWMRLSSLLISSNVRKG